VAAEVVVAEKTQPWQQFVVEVVAGLVEVL
jgi:hypothetical protein